jgi:hypothetical protein
MPTPSSEGEIPGDKQMASSGYIEGRRKWALDFVHSHVPSTTRIDAVVKDAKLVEDYLADKKTIDSPSEG